MCAMERRLKEKLQFKGDPKWRRKLAWKCAFGVLCFHLAVYISVQEMWVTGFVLSLSFCFQQYLHCFAFNQVVISWVQYKHQLLFSSKLLSKHCGPRLCSFCGARERKKRDPKSTKNYLSVFFLLQVQIWGRSKCTMTYEKTTFLLLTPWRGMLFLYVKLKVHLSVQPWSWLLQKL